MKARSLILISLVSLISCSTKKYLPKIFNPDMAKIEVNDTMLYYEKHGKGIPVVMDSTQTSGNRAAASNSYSHFNTGW